MSRNNFVLFLPVLFVLIIGACTNTAGNSSGIGNLQADVFQDEVNNLTYLRLNGSLIDSALWIKSYEVQYFPQKIVLKITRTLKPTGNSGPYYIQFLLPDNIDFVFLGKKEVIWERNAKEH